MIQRRGDGSDDPRWNILKQPNATCTCCGDPMSALLSFAYSGPDVFPDHALQQENWVLLQEDGDILTEDFCRLDKYRFVRCILELPLLCLDDMLTIGVWGTLSIENFDRYVESFDDGQQEDLGEMFSWLSNPVPPDMPPPIAMSLRPQNDRQRPKLMFSDKDHPLYRPQRDGLSFDQLAELLNSYGHDIMKPSAHH